MIVRKLKSKTAKFQNFQRTQASVEQCSKFSNCFRIAIFKCAIGFDCGGASSGGGFCSGCGGGGGRVLVVA